MNASVKKFLIVFLLSINVFSQEITIEPLELELLFLPDKKGAVVLNVSSSGRANLLQQNDILKEIRFSGKKIYKFKDFSSLANFNEVVQELPPVKMVFIVERNGRRFFLVTD